MTTGEANHGRSVAVDSGDERLLVLVSGSRDRELLTDWLSDGYEVVTATPGDEWPAFDACLVDAGWYERARDDIAAACDRTAAHRPVLLLVPESRVDEPWVDRALAGVADDVLSVPARKRHLHARLSSLLRARRLSRDLAAERDRFRTLTESANDAIVTVDGDGLVRYANPAVAELFGHAPSELVGEPLARLIPERFRDRHEAAFEAYLATGDRTLDWSSIEFTGLHADGHEFPIEVSFATYRADGERRFTGIIRDVSERKAREEQLRLTGRAVDAATVGISIADADDDEPLVYVNEAFEDITGYAESEVLGRNCRFLQGPETDPEAVAELRRAIDARESTTVVLLNYRKDGTPFWNELTVAPVWDGDEATHFVGFQQDVTERRQNQVDIEETAAASRELYRIAADRDRDFEAKLDAVLELGTEYLDLEFGALTRIVDGEQHVVAAHGERAPAQDDVTPLAETYCRRALDGDGRLAVRAASEEGWAGDPAYERFGLESYVGTRLDVDGGAYGTLLFADHDARDRAFDEREHVLVDLMSQWVAFELERRERERELRETLERITDGFFALDDDWRFTYANDRAGELIDVDPDAVVGERLWDEFPAAVGTVFEEQYRHAMTTQEAVQFEAHFEPLDAWFEVHAFPDADGLSVFFRDVTERKERERTLQRTVDLFGQAQAIADIGAWEYDIRDDRLFWTDQMWAIHGLDDTFEPTLADVLALYPADAAERIEREAEEMLEAGDTLETELAYETPDGEQRWFHVHAEARFEDGEPVRLVGTTQDVTERHEQEEQLATALDLLEQAQDIADLGAWQYDVSADELYVTDQVFDIYGVPASFDMTPEAFIGLYGPDDRERLEATWGDSLEDGDPYELELTYETPGGEQRWLLIHGEPVVEVGEVTLVRGTVQDITEPLEREREVRRYRTMMESAANPIYALDPEGRFTHVNGETLALTDHDREELLGESAEVVFGEGIVREVNDRIRRMLREDERTGSFEVAFETADGETRNYRTSLSLLFDDGEFDGTVVVAQDITEIRRHERRLSVLDRVFRHNVRNRLNVVSGHLAELAEEGDWRAAAAFDAVEDLHAMTESARRFQDSIRPGEAEVATAEVVDIVGETVSGARTEHPEATIRTDFPAAAWARVPGALPLAVEELVDNAVEHDDDDDPHIEVAIRETDDAVEVRVADDGPGIPEMTREALTRGTETQLEHSLGLGLWLVRWTVTNAGGELLIEDNDPAGTVVVLRFPAAD